MTWQAARRSLSLVLFVLSVGYVVWRIASDRQALELLGEVPVWSAVLLIAVQVIYLLPQAYRYLLVLRMGSGRAIPALAWLRLFILGRFLNSLVPQAGTFYRGLRLREDFGVPVARFLGGYVAFTWLSTILNLAVASIVIGTLEPDLDIGGFPALAITLIGLLGITAAPPAALWVVNRLPAPAGAWGWMKRRLEDLLTSSVALFRVPDKLAVFVLVWAAGLALALSMFSLALTALDLDLSVSGILLFFALLQFGSYVTITPGNLGVLELGFGALGAQLGIGLVGGLLVAALLRVSGYIALLLSGVALGGIDALREARDSPECVAM